MLIGWPPPIILKCLGLPGCLRICSMCCSSGTCIVVGMPDQPLIVGRAVFARMIGINIDDMFGKISHERPPTWIATAGVLDHSSINGIILVIIMGDERSIALVPHGFVIGIELPKMPPAVLINDFTPIEKRVMPLNGGINQRLILSIFIGATRGQVGNDLRVGIPFRRDLGLQSAMPP